MEEENEALKNYYSILNGEKTPKYLIQKRNGELKEKINTAYKILESCVLCERKCKVNRMEGIKGKCELLNVPRVNSSFPHYGEEPFLVPSFTVFFSGCNFECCFCQNWSISQLNEGEDTNVEELARIFENSNSCKNLNLVGGSPTPQLPFILNALNKAGLKVPVVWNSNFFMTQQSMDLLNGAIDVYLSDFKYGNNECAKKYSGINDYFDIVKRNHLLAFKDAELVIRHLLLPSHFECCTKPILEFIAENFGEKAVVNVLDQYRPEFKASSFPELSRGINSEELDKALRLARELGLNFIH